MVKQVIVGLDNNWGLDHGCWSVVRRMYPNADVPVLQLSLDRYQSPDRHYNLAKDLGSLRRNGVLIIGSGKMVHNLRMINYPSLGKAAELSVPTPEHFLPMLYVLGLKQKDENILRNA